MPISTLAIYPLVQRGIKDKSIGSGYDPTQTYSKDALIYKGGKIYIAKQNDIAGPWNPALWDEVDILSLIEDVMGKVDSMSTIGRYLSDWNCQTGLPSTNPGTIPYTYTTGDYYIVGNVTAGTNYMPSGSSYTGDASTTVDAGNPQVLDMYRYDGTTWTLLHFGNAFRAFLQNYYTKGEADNKFALITALANYYTKTETYSKTEADGKFADADDVVEPQLVVCYDESGTAHTYEINMQEVNV